MRDRRRILDAILVMAGLLVALYVAALLLGGGENRRIPETAEIEETLLGDPDADVIEAACPDDPLTEAGDTLTCDVTLADGSTRRVMVELLNEDGWLTLQDLDD